MLLKSGDAFRNTLNIMRNFILKKENDRMEDMEKRRKNEINMKKKEIFCELRRIL